MSIVHYYLIPSIAKGIEGDPHLREKEQTSAYYFEDVEYSLEIRVKIKNRTAIAFYFHLHEHIRSYINTYKVVRPFINGYAVLFNIISAAHISWFSRLL